ncbi:hypothetical protein ACFFNY_08485 [Paenibacillus hodogayensis]|uniref:WD40 repeat domain-containing protein n=1 Tax=Paenibacillus hodogayensis TaxID=279208 RepID=A0ABV5VTJ2_9BACL
MEHNLLAAIPELFTRFVQLPNDKGHNAVWDFRRSPDNRYFISVCGENEKPLTALLYEYDPDTGDLRLIFDVARVWIVDAEQMPPSKIHTSIDFLPDGKLIMATHNTAPAPGHKQWMYEQHYEHPWEGYPGSIVMIVDPDTGDVRTRGIPVPRESIYGGMLGNDPRYYYFLGYMRGHFYRLDLETNEVRDYGKVSEFSSCRLAKDERGRLYGSSYTGGLWRYDPVADRIEDLKISFESPNGTKYRRQFIFALNSPRNTLLLVDNTDGELIELHPDTLEATRHGPIHLPGDKPQNMYLIGGLAADERFVLYYGLKTYDANLPIRLVRWDVLNGGKPENLGLVSPGGKASQYICEMLFDCNGWLHMVDVCGEHSPYILAVDAGKLQPPGPDAPKAHIEPYAEPDWNGVGEAAYMHIAAETVRTLPLHRFMDWSETAVAHLHLRNGQVFAIGGGKETRLTVFGCTDEKRLQIAVLYDGGGPVSCADVGGRTVVLTSDGCMLLVDYAAGQGRPILTERAGVSLARLHGSLGEERWLASDREGGLYVCGLDGIRPQPLEHVRVRTEAGSHIVVLDDKRILLSGRDDELLVYDMERGCGEKLAVKAPSIRGRAFRATVSGGAVLGDGTVVAGTQDGLLFTLSPDLGRKTSYGRLFSAGPLRNMIRYGDEAVLGIYGGYRDAGHVFHYSRASGFVDWGRPRVIKDNPELYALDTEWASIHYISCLAHAQQDEMLYVASGEQYGCMIRYKKPACPR